MLSRNLIAPSLKVYDIDGTLLTYEEFLSLVDCWKEWLTDQGFGPEHRLILSVTNILNIQSLFFACMELGIVFLCTGEASFYYLPKYQNAPVAAAITDVPVPEGFLSYPVIECPTSMPYKGRKPALTVEPVGKPTNPAMLSLTSGTTGQPTMIVHTHESLLGSTEASLKNFSPEDRCLLYMSFNHLGSLTFFNIPAILTGTTVVLCHGSQAIHYINKANKYLLFEWNWFTWVTQNPSVTLSGATIFTGGAVISKNFIDSVLEHGAKKVIVAYGMTESPPPVIVKNVTKENAAQYEARWLGETVGEWQYSLVDGFLAVRGPGVGFDKDGASLASQGGWMVTKDKAYEKNGRLYYEGRGGQVKRNGQTIFMDDLWAMKWALFSANARETYFLMEDDTTICCAVAGGTMLDGTPITLEKINAVLTANLTSDHTIDFFMELDEIPNNGLKTDFPRLRDMVRQKTTGMGSSS